MSIEQQTYLIGDLKQIKESLNREFKLCLCDIAKRVYELYEAHEYLMLSVDMSACLFIL